MKAYNPDSQYRCTIIRGKAQNEIDDLLPSYAKAITDACPCNRETFIAFFDKAIAKFLSSPTKKTIANHRTEIAGKLFGMYWEDGDGIIHASNRTERLLENRDNPEFFKDIISTQFSNLKAGDRFHYENYFNPLAHFTTTQIYEIRKATMAKIICNNMNTPSVPQNPFNILSNSNTLVTCADLHELNWSLFL